MLMNLVIALVFIVTVGSACIVAFSRNLIYSAFALIGTFFGVAASFVILSADFVGLAQIMIYAGGILVLTVFAVMLTSRIEEVKRTNPAVNRKAAIPVMIIFVAFLGVILTRGRWASLPPDAVRHVSTIGDIGNALLTDYLLPFELISVLLLMAMVGAAIISRRQVRGE